MSRHLALHDGLFLGSSSAVNLVACVRLARAWGHNGRGRRIVTILCDSGARHASRFWCVVLPPLRSPLLSRTAPLVPSRAIVASGKTDKARAPTRRNDEYLSRAGIPLSSSIDFLYNEPPLRAPASDDGPDPTHDTELASDDPRDLPPPPPALLETPRDEKDARFAPA